MFNFSTYCFFPCTFLLLGSRSTQQSIAPHQLTFSCPQLSPILLIIFTNSLSPRALSPTFFRDRSLIPHHHLLSCQGTTLSFIITNVPYHLSLSRLTDHHQPLFVDHQSSATLLDYHRHHSITIIICFGLSVLHCQSCCFYDHHHLHLHLYRSLSRVAAAFLPSHASAYLCCCCECLLLGTARLLLLLGVWMSSAAFSPQNQY